MLRDLLADKRSPLDIVSALPDCTGDLSETVEKNLSHLLESWRTSDEFVASTTSYMAGMLSGYLRPYWYSRGQGVTDFLEEGKVKHKVFTPFLQWLGPPFNDRPDRTNGLVPFNFSGSGVITDPAEFLDWFEGQEFDGALISALVRRSAIALSIRSATAAR